MAETRRVQHEDSPRTPYLLFLFVFCYCDKTTTKTNKQKTQLGNWGREVCFAQLPSCNAQAHLPNHGMFHNALGLPILIYDEENAPRAGLQDVWWRHSSAEMPASQDDSSLCQVGKD